MDERDSFNEKWQLPSVLTIFNIWIYCAGNVCLSPGSHVYKRLEVTQNSGHLAQFSS
jgi:hypothetical protein